MLRRYFLGSAAAIATFGLPGSLLALTKRPRVGVMGGGIVGASIAMHLARQGAQVFLFEKDAPAMGATQKSLAWINPIVLDKDYMNLRLASMEAWRTLDRQMRLDVTWGGSISWAKDAARGENIRAKIEILQGTADVPRVLTAEQITEISPPISTGEIFGAFFAPADGHVDPVAVTLRFLDDAKAHGASVSYPCSVDEIHVENGRLTGVTTSKGRVALDHLVSACGVDTTRMMSLIGHKLELRHTPGLMVHTKPQQMMTRMAYEASGAIELKQMSNGVVAIDFAAGPPDLPQHADIRKREMQYPSEQLREFHGKMLIGKASAFMPKLEGITPDKVMLCFKPMPTDQKPVVGAVPGVAGAYVVVTHSGVTLAPLLGQYVAQEVLNGTKEAMLALYRPDRFAS